MKLIYIANARIPTEKAHGIQIMKMCEAFASSGIEVELVAPWRFNRIKQNPFEYYGVKQVFKIKKLLSVDLIPLDFLFGNFALWVQTISFLVSAKIYLFLKSVVVRGLLSVAIRKTYDILYTREPFTGLFFKNYVLEIHSLPSKINSLHKKIWKKAKALVVLTNFIKDKLIWLGISEQKILVAPDAVDLEEFDIKISREEARKKLNLPKDKFLIGYVGMLKTLEMEKGIDVAIKSLKLLEEDALLVLVGGLKEDIEFYKKLAVDFNLKNRILFTGQLRHALIPLYLRSFDVLIAPFPETEHYKFYMSPLKLFEYMASGRPIIASDLSSIREILNEGNAVLVEPNNPEALAEGIKKVLQDKNLTDRISRQAFENVKEYTWDKRVEIIINFISK